MKRWVGPASYLARRLYSLHLDESVLRLAYKLLRKSDQARLTSRFYRALGKILVRYLMWAQALVTEGVEPAHGSTELAARPSSRLNRDRRGPKSEVHHLTAQALAGGPDHEHQMLTLTTAKQLLEQQEKICVIECLCRRIESRCSSPRETCLLFGRDAEDYIESGRGRRLALEEACELVDKCLEAGLVQNVIMARGEAMGLCNCCKCCCLAIIGTRFQVNSVRSSGYVAALSGNSCVGCEICRQVCPFGAINGEREINIDQCRGCGLCVSHCPQDNISLIPSG